MTAPETYTRSDVTDAYRRAVAQVDYYDTEAERAAFVDACIALHMQIVFDSLPVKYALANHDE